MTFEQAAEMLDKLESLRFIASFSAGLLVAMILSLGLFKVLP